MDMNGVSNSSNSEVINTVLTASKLKGDRFIFPTSYQQQGLWLLEQMNPGHATYNIPFGCFLHGKLDTDSLEKALRIIIKKYEIFRTTFGIIDGSVSQIVWDDVEFSLPYVDIESNVSIDPKEYALSLANFIVQQAFDINKGPFFRFAIIRIQPHETLFVASLHHIVFDGESINPFLSELSDLYTQIATNRTDEPSLMSGQAEIQYADYAVWQREKLSKDYEAKLIDFWKKELEDVNTLLELPSDNPRPAVQAFDGDFVEINFEPELTQQLKKVACEHKTSLYVVILSALYVLLNRYTKQETILIGSPFADRSLSELENAVGFFARTIVLKGDLSNNPTFSELIQRIRESVLTVLENQDLPFESLVEKLHHTRDQAFNPFFQVMFGLQSLSSTPTFGNLQSRLVRLCTKTSMFDLFFDLREEHDGVHGIVEFPTSLFARESIVRLVAQYKKALQEIVKNPNQPIWKIPILPEKEVKKLLVEWNDTYCKFPDDKCIHQLFEAQVTPDRIALVTPEERLTYEELNRRANKLAHYLLNLGVKPEDKVGVCLTRNADLVISLLAVLKAGGAYLALDPAYPKDRNAFAIANSGAQIVMTSQSLQSDFADSTATLVCIDQKRAEIEAHPSENVNSTVNSQNLAYVIYTSGSTGKPKGVMVHHQAAVNFLCSMRKKPGINRDDKLLAVTTYSFDISVLELYLPLIAGATVVVATREQAVNGNELINIIKQEHINVMQATPATWRLLIASGWQGDTNLKALCGGESLQRTLVKDLLPKTSELWNMYGPTETTVWSTCYRITTADRPALIGKPIDNTQCYVLGENLQPVPIGVPGELYIGGSGVSQGYLDREELTAERFVDNPFSNNKHSKLYRTGDLVKYNREGNLEYIQRNDNQVKVRGFRIELGEIETVMAEIDSIIHTCVVVREVRIGDPRIYAYFVLAPGKNIAPTEIRKNIKQKLPDYMIPQYFIQMDQLPLMPNGKIDKKALPLTIATPTHEAERVAPRNNIEKSLVRIWGDVIDISSEQISIDDNFFDIGGNSLTAVLMFNRIEECTGRHFSISTLYRASTVRQLAALLNDNVNKNSFVEAGTDQHLATINVQDDVINGTLRSSRNADIGFSTVSSAKFHSVVTIQSEGHKTPLFLIHGAAGNVLMYRSLAERLGPEQPVYALESVGLNQSNFIHKTIEEMGIHYADEIMATQVEGPYIVGGYCMGGTIALEVAQILKQRRKEVSYVILLDSTNFSAGNDHPFINFCYQIFQLSQYHWQHIWQLDQGKKLNYLRATVNLTMAQARRAALRMMQNRSGAQQGVMEADKKRHSVWQANEYAWRSYVPDKYEGKVILFKQYHQFGYSRELGWEKVAVDGIDVEILPAYPQMFLYEPYVASLASSMKKYLDNI